MEITLPSPMSLPCTCSRQRQKKDAIVCMCVCNVVHDKSSSPWVTKTWLRQNWNESATKHWCNVHSRGLALSFLSGGVNRERETGSMRYYAVQLWEGWKKLSVTRCWWTKHHEDEELWYSGGSSGFLCLLLMTLTSVFSQVIEREWGGRW